jgi:hypothetical protein
VPVSTSARATTGVRAATVRHLGDAAGRPDAVPGGDAADAGRKYGLGLACESRRQGSRRRGLRREYDRGTGEESSVDFTPTIVTETVSENVTLYINTQALVASQGVDAEALAASVDGNYAAYSTAGPGDSWVAVQTTGNNSTVSFRSSVFNESTALSDPAADPPKNTDSDYAHEDFDGDGSVDFTDVVSFAFSNPGRLNESLPPDERAALDFDGNGDVDFGDVAASGGPPRPARRRLGRTAEAGTSPPLEDRRGRHVAASGGPPPRHTGRFLRDGPPVAASYRDGDVAPGSCSGR